jgi:hypothetical protein
MYKWERSLKRQIKRSATHIKGYRIANSRLSKSADVKVRSMLEPNMHWLWVENVSFEMLCYLCLQKALSNGLMETQCSF